MSPMQQHQLNDAKSQGFDATHWANGFMYPTRTGKQQQQKATGETMKEQIGELHNRMTMTIDNTDCSDEEKYQQLVQQTDAQYHIDEIAKFDQYHRTLNKAAASHGE